MRFVSPKLLTNCLKQLLRPVIRFCLRHSLRLPQFVEVAKVVFLEIAQEELAKKDEKFSASRVSIMTGVHRKDFERIQAQLDSSIAEPDKGDVILRVIGQWRNDRRFMDSVKNRPKELMLHAGKGDFAALVASVSTELNPYSLLLELERLSFVKNNDGKITLIAREYVPKGDLEATLKMVANDISDLILAAEENILKDPEIPQLQLSTRYDNVAIEYLPQIRNWFLKQGESFHNKARKYLSKFDLDISPRLKNKVGGGKVVIGTFSRTEEADEK
jgi:hypothetical protein